MTLTLELLDSKKEAVLKARAEAQGMSAEEYAAQILDRELQIVACEAGSSVMTEPDDERPIWEVITDMMKDMPPEDMAALPSDGASQVDHYIYGLPKRY